MATHDYIFKEIFGNFLMDLMQLTPPWLRRTPVRPRALPTELFADGPRRRRREVDLAALV